MIFGVCLGFLCPKGGWYNIEGGWGWFSCGCVGFGVYLWFCLCGVDGLGWGGLGVALWFY